jgi:3'(2'), 5'-bisphosphate nucleotidase
MSLTLATSGFTASIASSPAARSRARAARGASSHRRCKPHAFQRRAAVLIADSAADLGLDGGEYSRELETALEAVRLASTLCQDVQGQLMRMDEQAETKEDRSLVTLADYAAQAIISWCVRRRFDGEMERRAIVCF